MPKRISAADRTPVRVVIVTMDSHLGGRSRARRMRRCAASCRTLKLTMHAADEWGSDPAALTRCHADIARGRHRDRHDAVPRGPHPRRAAGAGGAARPLRRHDLLHVRRRGGEADARSASSTWSAEATGAIALLKRLRGSEGGSGSSGARPDEDAAAVAADCCASFRARRRTCGPISWRCNTGWPVRKKTSPTWCACWSVVTPAGTRAHLAGSLRVGAAGRISRSRPLSPARAPAASSNGSSSCPSAGPQRHASACWCCGPTCWPATPATTTA